MPVNPPIPIPPNTVDVTFGEWTPDTPDFNNPGSPNVLNVYPRTETSYGPIPALTVYNSSALTARCQGASAFLNSQGVINLFAGDTNDLYQMTASSGAWSNVSKSLHAYNCVSTDWWNYEYFNGAVIATNISDNPQTFTVGSGTAFADLGGTPPKGRYVAAVKSFLVFANTWDAADLFQPQRIWWSGVGDATSWPTPGGTTAAQVQSSRNDLLGKAGWITGIVGNLGNADGAIFQEHAVTRMVYAGPPQVFDFLPVQGVKGCPAPASIVQFGAVVYYLGEDGFYAFDGIQSVPIGANKIDKTFYADLNQAWISRVQGTADPLNKLIWWAYPSNSSAGTPDTLICYNWQLGRWGKVSQSVEALTRLLTLGYTLDQLYTVLGYTIDGLPAPLDSRVWAGGLMTFGAFNTSHKLSYFTGPNLAATVDTTESQISPGQKTFVCGARPWVDAGVNGGAVTPSISIGVRDRMNDAVTFKTAQAMNSFGTCPQRACGRYVRARMTTLSGDVWNHLLGVELDVRPVGNR